MDVWNWLQVNGPILSLLATMLLVLITAIYVYLTKKILDSTISQSKLIYSPVIGIRLGTIGISQVFGPSRRNLNVDLSLTNVGNAPAIEILVDGEILLQYTNIEGEKMIPSRFEPIIIPFITPGEEIKNDMHGLNFGNKCIKYLLDDFRECHRLNIQRIKTDPTKEAYSSSKLRIIIYYRNNIGQYFETTAEAYLHAKEIPEQDDTNALPLIHGPILEFHAGPISRKEIDNCISSRNKKRYLCGW